MCSPVSPPFASVTIPPRQCTCETRCAPAKKSAFKSEHHALSAATTAGELADLIESLNRRQDVDGILVQLPLPGHLDESGIIEAINPEKDVDGFHPITVGRLAMGRPTFVPCTPAGIIELLVRSNIQISGVDACVVGRSQIVGRPMAQLLLQR